MNPIECEFEAEVLAAVCQSRWPHRVDESLRAHVGQCPICAGLLTVASAFEGAYEETVAAASLPDASRIWRISQLRARHEAVQAANRPLTAAHVIAFALALSILSACFGATSEVFQSALKRLDVIALVLQNGAFVLGLIAAICLIPTIFYLALGRD